MTSKRERELARAKWERQQARRQQSAERQSFIKRATLAGLGIVLVAILIATNSTSTSPSASASRSPYPSSAPSNGGIPDKDCKPHGQLNTTAQQFSTPPTSIPAAKSLTLITNCGTIGISLDSKAPKTTQIMSNLAAKNYFDRTACHRLTTNGIYVLQCGDPSATGSGGPGFKFNDENLPKASANGSYTYPRGTIAMANSGPNTNGSQFFIVYKDSPLGPNYSVWGHVTTGLDAVDKIAQAGVVGSSTDGRPAADVAIMKATIS
jgi:peptidyl-prolyl cis-trans isomerase B (cyclophilin B)